MHTDAAIMLCSRDRMIVRAAALLAVLDHMGCLLFDVFSLLASLGLRVVWRACCMLLSRGMYYVL
jgi:hypothetical protein